MIKVLILAFVPILCFSQIKLMSPTVCAMSNLDTNCGACNDGDLYLSGSNLCFPPCPSGFKTLLPGYCVNSTVISNHQTFTLEQDPHLYTQGGTVCTTYNPQCSCAPGCPSGYNSDGCQCVYGSSSSSAEVNDSHTFLYILSAIGVAAIIFGAGYMTKRFLNSRQVKIPLQSSPSIEVS